MHSIPTLKINSQFLYINTQNITMLFALYMSRLAGKYRWREFPAVITGDYRPGKYSKFWQGGKYWEI